MQTLKSLWYSTKRVLPTSWMESYNAMRAEQYAIKQKKQAKLPLVARHTAPYTTHLPVLIALARATKIERVLELGSGLHSTPAFLDRDAFPDLVELVSIENDAEWYDTIKDKVVGDSRTQLKLIDGAVHEFVQNTDISRFDLIFIDDSISYEERSATIRAVYAQVTEKNIVAIHDFQDQPYRDAAANFQHTFYFNHFNPAVGVVWNGAPLSVSTLKRLNRKLLRHQDQQPDNVAFWSKTLNLTWLDSLIPF